MAEEQKPQDSEEKIDKPEGSEKNVLETRVDVSKLKLPEKIGPHLDLKGAKQLTKLPENMKVPGKLDLDHLRSDQADKSEE